jgi:N-methylhydantoinase B
MQKVATSPWQKTDPVLAAVLVKRFEAITKRMTNTLLRSGRSGVLNIARDFSCSIITGDNRLVLSGEGLPVHVIGSHLMGQAMTRMFNDLRPGDTFLHNSPYHGNTHHADLTVMTPVFFEGRHVFTTLAKAHQADIGNSLPTTYMPYARDIYEEGALCFPCVRIQRDYKDSADLIRMIQMRIRVPDQWYGDYLAQVGACRIGERELVDLLEKYGHQTIDDFLAEWFAYGEQRMVEEIRKLPAGTWEGYGAHDPVPRVAPEGVPIHVRLTVDPEAGYITVDLRDNIDCVEGGLNESECCSLNNTLIGILDCLDPQLPHNDGGFSRIRVLMRENCVVGYPIHPRSCSMATTNVGDRLINVVHATFAQIGEGRGVAEGGVGMAPAWAVVSGYDWRRNGPYINQIFIVPGGGPGTPGCDGWLTYGLPDNQGVLYKDSIELDEQKYPILVEMAGIIPDSGGAGQWDGAPGCIAIYGPRRHKMTAVYPSDGHVFPPKGVRGGQDGGRSDVFRMDRSGKQIQLPHFSAEEFEPHEKLVSIATGGGGYGDPLKRDPELVRWRVREGWISLEKAKNVYGVVVDTGPEEYRVDEEATKALRAHLRANAKPSAQGSQDSEGAEERK